MFLGALYDLWKLLSFGRLFLRGQLCPWRGVLVTWSKSPQCPLEFLSASWLKWLLKLSRRKWAGMDRLGVDLWLNYEPRTVLRKFPGEVHITEGVKPLVTRETTPVLNSSIGFHSSFPSQVALRSRPPFSSSFAFSSKRSPYRSRGQKCSGFRGKEQ